VGTGDKKQKRAAEDLRRGLSRSDAELACSGLLALEPANRTPHLTAVAALIGAEAARARGRREWNRLVPWAKRLEAEPRLVTALGEPAAHELRWALLWGCAFSGEWARAERFWHELATSAGASAPLTGALSAWIAARGAPSSVACIEPLLAGPDSPLGFDAVVPRAAPSDVPAPIDAKDAEGAVIHARARLGFEAFERWVTVRLDADPPAIAQVVAEVAAAISVRDALVRLEIGASDALAPLTLLPVCAERGGVSAHLLAGFRLAALDVRDRPTGRPQGPLLALLVRACLRDPALKPLVADALVVLAGAVEKRPEASESVLGALAVVAEHAPNPALWAAGGALLGARRAHGDRRSRALTWLETRAEAMIGDGRPLAAWLRIADDRARRGLLDFLAWRAPAGAVVTALLAAAPLDDERVRAAVGRCAEELLARLSTRYCAKCDCEHEIDEASWDELSPAARQAWMRLEDDLLSHSPGCLRLALERAPDAAARNDVLDRCATRARSAWDWLVAIAAAYEHRLRKAPRRLLESLITRYAADPSELASAFEAAVREVPRAAVLEPLARALVSCVDAWQGSLPSHAAVSAERARRLLSRTGRRMRAPRSGRASVRERRLQGQTQLEFGGDRHGSE
jgi:hypothetical protein